MISLATNSGIPPAFVPTTAIPVACALEHAATERLGIGGVDEHIQAAHHRWDVGSSPGERDPRSEQPVSQILESFEVCRLHHADVPHDGEVGLGDRTCFARHRVEEHLDALALVDSPHDPDESLVGLRPERCSDRRVVWARTDRSRSTPGRMTRARLALLSRLPAVAALLTTVAEASLDASRSTLRPMPGRRDRPPRSPSAGEQFDRPTQRRVRRHGERQEDVEAPSHLDDGRHGRQHGPQLAEQPDHAGVARPIGAADPVVHR